MQPRPWREILPVHPAAELFPLLSREELTELAADINKRGMLMPILVRRHDAPAGPGVPEFEIVDGRSRLDAMTLAGLPLFGSKDGKPVHNFRMVVLDDDADPYAVAISANLKRRHLTAAQRREAIGKYIKRSDQSDRQISLLFGVDHTTIGDIRRKGEATGGIPPVDRRVGADGKSRPVKRQPRPTAAERKEVQPGTAPARAAALEQPAETRRTAVNASGNIVPRTSDPAQTALEQFVAGFGIVGEDLDRLYRLINPIGLVFIAQHPENCALSLVDLIGIDAAEAYAKALQRAVVAKKREVELNDGETRSYEPEDGGEPEEETETEPGPLVWYGTEQIGYTAEIEPMSRAGAKTRIGGYLILGPERNAAGKNYTVHSVNAVLLEAYNRERKRPFRWRAALRRPSLTSIGRLLRFGLGGFWEQAATLEAAKALAQADQRRRPEK